MKDKNGFLCLQHSEIKHQIKERTGLPSEYITKFMACYHDIIREALLMGIEVPIADVGRFSFDVTKPRPAGIYWDGLRKTRHEFLARQGYYRLKFDTDKNFKKKLKGATLFGERADDDEYWAKMAENFGWEYVETRNSYKKYMREKLEKEEQMEKEV